MTPPASGTPYEPTPISESVPPGGGGHGIDSSTGAGADERVPASVGAHSTESAEGAAGGHGSGGSGSASEHGSGADHVGGHGSGNNSSSPSDGSGHDASGGHLGDGSGHDGPGGHSGDGHGGRHDPVHSDEEKGDGWHRVGDKPDNPHYGEPLERSWESGPYPTRDGENNSTFDLVGRPDEPYGHDVDGRALTKAEYDERYNKIGTEGEEWENYPPNDGAVPYTRIVYDSGEAYLRDYGPYLDRIGEDYGTYLGVMPDGEAPSFEGRSLPISSLNLPYSRFVLNMLPDGWNIEISQIAPAFGRDGGELQVLIYNELGRKQSVAQLLEDGVLN
jgi:Tuberculosis necrotizing toxin